MFLFFSELCWGKAIVAYTIPTYNSFLFFFSELCYCRETRTVTFPLTLVTATCCTILVLFIHRKAMQPPMRCGRIRSHQIAFTCFSANSLLHTGCCRWSVIYRSSSLHSADGMPCQRIVPVELTSTDQSFLMR